MFGVNSMPGLELELELMELKMELESKILELKTRIDFLELLPLPLLMN